MKFLSCHVCETRNNKVLKNGYHYCRVCHAIYTVPINEEEYDTAYDADIDDQFEYLKYKGEQWISSDRLKYKAIENLHGNLSEYLLLDFGCGEGRFLRSIKTIHEHCVGYEVSGSAIKNQVEIIADQNLLISAIRGRKLIITLFEVIEHIENLEFLEKLWHNASECILWGTTGNHASLLARLRGKRWPYLMPQHCTIYSNQTFYFLADRLGGADTHLFNGFGIGREVVTFGQIAKSLPVANYRNSISLWKWFLNFSSSTTFSLKKKQ